MATTPKHSSYDVVIVGGAMIGSSIAFWLTRNPDFTGRVLVAERDPGYNFASTSHTNSCIRQQFGSEVNIKISRFGAEFIHGFKQFMEDQTAPEIVLQSFGYLYLSDNDAFSDVLRDNCVAQNRLGAATKIYSPAEMQAKWPFYNLDDIQCGSHNAVDEGYFDGGTIFDWFKKKARARGAEYIHNEVVAMDRDGSKITAVRLASGETVAAGIVINASGPRASLTAAMAGVSIPVEPRRRYTWIFDSPAKLGQGLPLTIDPSGVHMRQDGKYFMCGCPPYEDPAVDHTDFATDHAIFEDKVWPVLATRVPAFEELKVINHWVGHYAYNTLDQNAIIGPHNEISNFMFCNGFSGHGLQQSPAMGRGMAELILYGGYRTLDLSELGYERIVENRPLLERAVI